MVYVYLSVRLLRCHIYASPKEKNTFFSLFLCRFLRLPALTFICRAAYSASYMCWVAAIATAVAAVAAAVDAFYWCRCTHSFACTIIFQLFQIYLYVFFISIFRWIHRWLCCYCYLWNVALFFFFFLFLSRSVFDCFRTSQFCRICALAFFGNFSSSWSSSSYFLLDRVNLIYCYAYTQKDR